jgi:hypothetical protein
MPQIDQVFDSLSLQKSKLDANPFLDVSNQRGLESGYRSLHNIVKPSTSRQTTSRRSRAQQHLKNAYLIAKVLFVVVAVTVSATELASIEHDELFPRLEHWWHNNPPSAQFESRAVEYLEELDNRRKQNLLQPRGKNAPIPWFRITF